MDPISIIVAALATGAAAGLKPTAEKAIKDAYAGIKSLIRRKYSHVSIDTLEHDPASQARQSVVKEDLAKTKAGGDEELLQQAKAVLDAIQRYAPQTAEIVGVRLEDIRAASLKIADIISTGKGVDIRKAEIGGDIEIKGVRAGKGGELSRASEAAGGQRQEPTTANSKLGINLEKVTAGRDVHIHVERVEPVEPQAYLILKGVDPYKRFTQDPSHPWDLTTLGTVDVDDLRGKLLQIEALKEPLKDPTLMTVRGTLYPAALLSRGWWEKQDKVKMSEPWDNTVQKWLFYGFDLWGPSWDFSWDFVTAGNAGSRFIAQLGDGDEADSIAVSIPHGKARRLRELFLEGWGGLEVEVSGMLGHSHQFPKEPGDLDLVGGLLDYCIWLSDYEPTHKISPRTQETEIYSGYLWKCMAPRKWVEENKQLSLKHVYFIWEHTNFVEKDAIKYNLESLDHKEAYISKMHGDLDLVLLQKSSPLVLGQPKWSAQKFHNLLQGKTGEDI